MQKEITIKKQTIKRLKKYPLTNLLSYFEFSDLLNCTKISKEYKESILLFLNLYVKKIK